MNTEKKHIIVAGAPRAGKTLSICRALAKTGHYQHIAMDAITQSFEFIFPELGIFDGKTWEVGMPSVSEHIIDFLAHMVQSEKYDDLDYRMAIDTYQLMPEDYIKKVDSECCRAYFIGYPNISAEEKLYQIRKNETKWDWTRKRSDEIVKARMEIAIRESKIVQSQCQQYHLPFFDVSNGLDKGTKEMVKYILADNGYAD